MQRVFAAVYDPALERVERRGLAALRRRLLGGLTGDVVEIGAGTGANLQHYGPGVTRVTAVEPSGPMADRLRRRAGTVAFEVATVEAPAERLPVADDSADAVVSTLVLCSVRDVAVAVAEARRVLRPGGRFVLLEHVAGTGRLLRVQRALEPVWTPLVGGCHLTRDPRPQLLAAGFDLTGVSATRLPMPALVAPGLVGDAVAR
ncbi:class I SAM-dependent methyltransferase [Egicoccus sp. AB-alg2]|uniref:class I SAM-dependent methyltransferase n=1 Tax=Egicoccus sp. AB-alg2 TaxID=3242693 RepID=UPI00359D7BD8